MKRSEPLKRTPFVRTQRTKEPSTQRFSPRIKSRGMKGRPPTVEEERFMSAIAGLGCIACAKDGKVNPWVSIHHIKGRTAPGVHFLTLPLCAGHHQQGTGEDKSLIAVHPNRARFEQKYGTQMELLEWAKSMLPEASHAV